MMNAHLGLVPVKLHLTHNQLNKSVKGGSIQVKHDQIGKGIHLTVHPDTYKKLETAYKKGKGARIHLTKSELMRSAEHPSGGSIRDWLQKAGQWVKGALKSDFYQQAVKPLVRQGVDALTGMAMSKVSNPAAQAALRKGIDKVGEMTGAYGLDGTYSQLLGDSNPALHPIRNKLPYPGQEAPDGTFFDGHTAPVKQRGRKCKAGSFIAMGSRRP